PLLHHPGQGSVDVDEAGLRTQGHPNPPSAAWSRLQVNLVHPVPGGQLLDEGGLHLPAEVERLPAQGQEQAQPESEQDHIDSPSEKFHTTLSSQHGTTGAARDGDWLKTMIS